MSKRRVSNLLALAVLACLVERPMHPYEISTTLRTRGKEQSIKLNYGSLYSVVGTWARRLGTAIITVGMFMIYPQNHFLQYVGIVCMVLDGIFVALLHISAFGALISRWEPPAPLRTAPVKSLPFGDPEKPVARLGWRA